jgi:NifU-like protein involved in Fe-S cluster formation/metal-sulfur cluster biosynthetic enzyme
VESIYRRVYSDKLLEHFRNPRNIGEMPDADAKATEGSLACGDMVTVFIKVDPETRVITDIKFLSYGCAANIATMSVMTEMVKGMRLEEAKKLTFKDIVDALGGLPPTKMHCAVLSIDGLKSAIRSYELRRGLVKTPELDESLIRSELRHVMNPWLGRDLVSLGMVEAVDVKGGEVSVTLNLAKAGRFRDFILKEVNERLSALPNVKALRVVVKD